MRSLTTVPVAAAAAAGVALSGGCGWIGDDSSAGGVDGPVMFAAVATGDDAEAAAFEGNLVLDDGCLLLASLSDPSQRTPILWEHGTSWQDEPPTVILPDGRPIPVGANIQAGGGNHPPDQLSSFVSDDGVRDLADRCADDEVAVFQGGFVRVDPAPTDNASTPSS